MTAKQYIFLIATAAVFFGIALADLLIFNAKVTYNWFSVLHFHAKVSVVMFAIILLVLVVSPFIRKKK